MNLYAGVLMVNIPERRSDEFTFRENIYLLTLSVDIRIDY